MLILLCHINTKNHLKMTKVKIEQKTVHKQFLKTQLQDLFRLYLECNIAGDNQDRREKLQAVIEIEKILDDC